MVMRCVAFGCGNEHDKRKAVRFHCFPLKNPKVLKRWVRNLKWQNWQPTKWSKLCSAHFLDSDYETRPFTDIKYLKKDAVPSVFNYPGSTSNVTFVRNTKRSGESSSLAQSTSTIKMDIIEGRGTERSHQSSSLTELSPGVIDKDCEKIENLLKIRKLDSHTIEHIIENSDPLDIFGLDSPEMVDRYIDCSHRTESVFQLDHRHSQRKRKYESELFHAVVEPEQFSCIRCDHKSYYRFDLYEHFKQAHNPKTENEETPSFCEEFAEYPCHYCGYKSNSSLTLINHLCKVLRPSVLPVPIDYANEMESMPEAIRFQSTASIIRDQSEQIKHFECSHCSYSTARKDSLNRHMLQHTTNEEIDWFRCDQCSYQSKRKFCLKTHMLKHAAHEEIEWFKCSLCSYQCKRKSYLKTHMLKHATNKEIIDWFKCTQCSYQSKLKSYLKTHMLTHATNEAVKWFKCSHCSYQSIRKFSLKTHMMRHATNEEIAWLKCRHCSYRSKQKSNLKTHLLKHATSDWFKCSLCSFQAKKEVYLNRHMLQHATNEEIDLFKCNQCSYQSNRKFCLTSHMMTHAADKEIDWFKCSHCSYQSKRKFSLKTHMLRHATAEG